MGNEIISAFILGLIESMLTETIVALLSLLALSSMNFSERFFQGLSLVGAAILIWISTSIWKVRKIDTEDKVHFSLSKISAMIIANGVLWTFWITVCIPKAISLNEKVAFGNYLFLLLVEIGWLVSTVMVAFIFSRFRKILSNPKVVPIIFKIFALTFVYFAVDMIYNGYQPNDRKAKKFISRKKY